MSTQYDGIANNVTFPSPIAIQSTTDAHPIVVQTATAHGLMTGANVDIYDHLVNTHANVADSITVIDSTHFSLDGAISGNGAGNGGATGFVQPLTFGASAAIPSDGDNEDGATLDVQAEAIFDRSAVILYGIGAYKLAAYGVLGDTISSGTNGERIEDEIPPLDAFINHATTSGLVQMDQTAVSAPASWIIDRVQSGDILELMLEGTAKLLGTAAANYTATFAIGYQFHHSIASGSLVAAIASPSFGPSKAMSSPGSSALSLAPLSLRAIATVPTFDDGSLQGFCYVAPYCNVGGVSTATAKILGDYVISYRVWRQTGFPQ